MKYTIITEVEPSEEKCVFTSRQT